MIPLWKLKREAARLNEQIKGIAQSFYEPLQQRRHDKWRAQDMIVRDGGTAARGKVALILIYQPNGLPKTLLKTCDHLVGLGYAPLIVSNTPIAEADKTTLLSRSWKYIERPNFGYDFGGYRDGIWLLNTLGVAPDNLLILNDSVWFPIADTSDLVTQMEHCPADYVGTQVFERAETNKSTRKWAQLFFGSYCFMIKRDAFNTPAFQTYWQDYKLSSSKWKTLYRGERAFSYTLLDAGISAHGIFEKSRFGAVLDDLNEAELKTGLQYLVCIDPQLESQRTELLAVDARDAEWRDQARTLIKSAAETKNYIGSSPIISIATLGMPMIKKNNEMLYIRARQNILAAIENGDLHDIDPDVVAEMKARTSK